MDASKLNLDVIKDFLRDQCDDEVNLSTIIRLAELTTNSVAELVKSHDVETHSELLNIARQIAETKLDISAFRADEMHEEHIPQAGRELDAVVDATEHATNAIMEAAETIMAADDGDQDTYKSTVNEQVVRIFEACSFQDITGQRIAKVVATLTMIDTRITSILDRISAIETVEPESAGAETNAEDGLLNGPALRGEGVNQNDVDQYFP
ncbi:MAG: protein phosphatase CheZ [Pseudomonadota bacterium]